MKKQITLLSIAGSISLIVATAVWAQQSNTSNDQQMPNMQGMQMQNGPMQQGKNMPKDQMMQSCQKHMKPMMDSNTQTTKDIEAAKQSNDPVKMRAALDEAEKALQPMNEQMKGCLRMMDTMQNMHGKSGMMGTNNMQDKGQKTQPQN